MMRYLSATALAAVAGTAWGGEAVTYRFEGSFQDATFAVENAIIGKGLVIDFVSHVGDMLARTGEDVGSDVVLFDDAQVFIFCSALVSREVMEVDPVNLVHCPYGIYVADRGGEVTIGHRNFPEGPMDAVETLLEEIVADAGGEQ